MRVHETKPLGSKRAEQWRNITENRLSDQLGCDWCEQNAVTIVAGGVKKTLIPALTEQRQIIFGVRTEAGPTAQDLERAKRGGKFESMRKYRVHARRRNLFYKAGLFGRRTSQDAAIKPRHEITTRAVENVPRQTRSGLKAKHLSAHRSHLNSGLILLADQGGN